MITATKPDLPRLFPPSPAYSPLPNFEFRVSNFAFLPLSPFPATLTRNQRFCRKTPPVSPFLATLTDTPSRKSFPCHSYENMGGVPPLVPASKSRRPRNPLTPLESALTKNIGGRGASHHTAHSGPFRLQPMRGILAATLARNLLSSCGMVANSAPAPKRVREPRQEETFG